jgi:tartronate-semialdehyde synthase
MPRMRAVDAAVKILELEGATQAFGLPGAAINPFCSALHAHGASSMCSPATSREPPI